MPLIDLETRIQAPIERCFDLARSIEFHVVTAVGTGEQVVGGRRVGLISAGESVTWRARHLGLWQRLTVQLTVLERPSYFQDVMVAGPFASMAHDHRFVEANSTTLMRDIFTYRAPLGVLGSLADRLFLERHLRDFLTTRARILKQTAESDAWRSYLTVPPASG